MIAYFYLWLVLTTVLFIILQFGVVNHSGLAILPFTVLSIAAAIAAILVANELRRPQAKEYYRKKALYPKIPEQYLSKDPPTAGVVFGTDHHTGKLVAKSGHHCMIVGSTGSGKTACCLLPSILSHREGSAQIIDIKSRELSYKSADVLDPNTIIVDLDHRAPYVYGWDILYRLKRDGTDTEQEVLRILQEVASIVIPRAKSGDQFWNDSARALFIGLSLYEICYAGNYEFIDVVSTLMNVPLREHLNKALDSVPKTSLLQYIWTGSRAASPASFRLMPKL